MLRTEKNWMEGVRKHSQIPSSKHQMTEEVRLSITPVVLDLKNKHFWDCKKCLYD